MKKWILLVFFTALTSETKLKSGRKCVFNVLPNKNNIKILPKNYKRERERERERKQKEERERERKKTGFHYFLVHNYILLVFSSHLFTFKNVFI